MCLLSKLGFREPIGDALTTLLNWIMNICFSLRFASGNDT